MHAAGVMGMRMPVNTDGTCGVLAIVARAMDDDRKRSSTDETCRRPRAASTRSGRVGTEKRAENSLETRVVNPTYVVCTRRIHSYAARSKSKRFSHALETRRARGGDGETARRRPTRRDVPCASIDRIQIAIHRLRDLSRGGVLALYRVFDSIVDAALGPDADARVVLDPSRRSPGHPSRDRRRDQR